MPKPARRSLPPARLLNLLLLAVLLVGSLAAWPRLPDRIPAHFGGDGMADRWTGTSLAGWLEMPALAVAINLLVYALAALASRNVRSFNLPDKDRLLSLPAERQRVVLRRIRDGIEATAVPVTLSFCLAQLMNYRAAFGLETKPLFAAILVVAALGSPIAAIALLLRVQKEIDRQVRLDRAGRDENPVTPRRSSGTAADAR